MKTVTMWPGAGSLTCMERSLHHVRPADLQAVRDLLLSLATQWLRIGKGPGKLGLLQAVTTSGCVEQAVAIETQPIKDRPSTASRIGFPDGIFLAVSTAGAYVLAFAYETGFAEYFGYPYGVIELSLVSILMAWGGIAFACGVVVMVFLFLGTMTPGKVAHAILVNRTTFRLINLLILGVLGWYSMADVDLLWIGLTLLLVAGLGTGVFLGAYIVEYRSAAGSTILERMMRANKAIAVVDDRPLVKDAVVERALRHPAWGGFLSALWSFLLLVAITASAAGALGGLRARTQETFLVTGDTIEWVGARYYGDRVIALRLDRQNRTLRREYSVFPIADPHRVWSREHLTLRKPQGSLSAETAQR